ncbi:endonuclease III [Candidatus Peregrinibacteria bacterium]|nr:endonuclease III [Candidatus Peregrinibacteria bacterium]
MAKISIEVAYRRLQAVYKPPRTFLHFRTPLDLAVVTILSAQCTDARVNIVSTTLFAKYKTPEDYLRVPRAELEQDIHSCGTYKNKAKYIQELCRIILEKHGGKIPQTMEELTALPGIGRKTASILLYAVFGKNEGIAVDTHVLRVAKRLGLTKHTHPVKVEKDLMAGLPREKWGDITTLLISHGRAICTARNRQCEKCLFQKNCPSSRVRGRSDLAKPEIPALMRASRSRKRQVQRR